MYTYDILVWSKDGFTPWRRGYMHYGNALRWARLLCPGAYRIEKVQRIIVLPVGQ